MIRDYQKETERRVEFIRETLLQAGAKGIIYGNSGGKDSALVGILCKKACDNTVGVIMPCGSQRNYNQDKEHGMLVAKQYGIECRLVDLTSVRDQLTEAMGGEIQGGALTNIPPRLRMTTLYAFAAKENRLVAGTGNLSESYIGYYTKWGDGACDFNPISDLTVTEVYDFLRFLEAPEPIISKPPSAGLFEGQTDEDEIGISYKKIDDYLLTGVASDEDRQLIERYHKSTQHKRRCKFYE